MEAWMRVLDFLDILLGHRVTAPGGDGGQCVDLVNLYLMRVLGLPQIHANAVDWANVRLAGRSWVVNLPRNAPARGDIVVWGREPKVGTGVNGHIAIALTADDMVLLSFDQNWPEGAPVSIVVHTYAGVLGWHAAGG
jgi:hypothetical protein